MITERMRIKDLVGKKIFWDMTAESYLEEGTRGRRGFFFDIDTFASDWKGMKPYLNIIEMVGEGRVVHRIVQDRVFTTSEMRKQMGGDNTCGGHYSISEEMKVELKRRLEEVKNE